MSFEYDSRRALQVQTLTVGTDQFTITIAQQPLNDGFWYSLRLNQAFPALTGKETVYIVNGTQNIQLVDRRGRAILSERVLRYGERLRGVYTENGPGTTPTPIFVVYDGISPVA